MYAVATVIVAVLFTWACEIDTDSKTTAGGSCAADGDCVVGLICTGAAGSLICSQAGTGAAGSVCGINDHCTSPLVCGAGACGVTLGGSCAADGDCVVGLICTGAAGRQVCSQAGTGAAGSVCGINDHCTSPLVCGAGACGVTLGGSCAADGDCVVDLICTGAAGSLVCSQAGTGAAGSVCGINDHCTSPLVCGAGACGVAAGDSCTADGNCAGSLVCIGARSSQVCGTAGDGSAGSVCGINDHCDYACLAGACTAGAAGNQCVDGSHCISNVCSSVNVCQ